MAANDMTWVPIASDVPVFACGYRFGPGHAHALAVPCVGGGFAIVSPPYKASESAYAEIEKLGKVRALVASNAFHNLGIAAWKARFPDAALFAPAQSIARVEKKAGVTGVKPLADFAPLAAPGVELIDMPHYKTGEVLVRVKHGAHVVWYVTDVIMNMSELPRQFPFKQLFGWTKSAPGLRPNGVAPLFMVKDKASLHRWLRAEVDKVPPTILVPCHGDAITSGAAEQLRAILPA